VCESPSGVPRTTNGMLFSVGVGVGLGELVGVGVRVMVGVSEGSEVTVAVAVPVGSSVTLACPAGSAKPVDVWVGKGVVLRTTGAEIIPEAASRTIRMIIINTMPTVMLEQEPRFRRAMLGKPLWESADARRLTIRTGSVLLKAAPAQSALPTGGLQATAPALASAGSGGHLCSADAHRSVPLPG